ncbi:MAG: 4a-hydroxytetrahydrobiopterin dehydratase [Aquificaceae bacterium]|nr:4a-hydroxytetrahydrobiopterin dehydratase [Aquificaceae bacterium]MCS7195835.1 4a-hydroxytetrahydrobiopterin dehydratase [Aquificaceae bacterium]MCX7989075.1 4a-hydroxytetrahydrobiopterin dehydratase [Aquificaceae bacterium]MDW8032224.1 4a-hydroxytetrahydrobiopterin dehydratase [Aquificaceae bacterium]MDW8293882.1 4a-hydroxytetrahydrobiopterin dehydratase [Aquificaceae bacterium]
MKVYSEEEIRERLGALPQWHYEEGYLTREYSTKNWRETSFLFNAIASLAEVHWHHPDLEVSYKKLKVKLLTHEAKGITDRDFELAGEIEKTVSLLAKRWYNI